MRNSFVMFRSFWEAGKGMSNEDRLAFYDALCKYYFEDIEPELSGVPQMAFLMAKPNVDASNKNYDKCVENGKYGVLGAEEGKKWGRPKKGETREEYLERKKKETPINPLKGNNEKPPKNPLDYDLDYDDDLDEDLDKDFFIKEKVKLNFFLKNLSNYEQETDRFLEFNKNTDSKMLLYYLKMWKPVTTTNLFPKSVSDFLNELYERGKDDKDIYNLMGLKEVKVNGNTVYFIIKDKKTFDIIEKYIQRDDKKFFGNRAIQYFPLKAEERKERERCSA